MFDSVLARSNQPGSRFGAGAIITVLVHAAVVALVIWLSSRPVEEEIKETEVRFFAAPPPPPPPPPPAGGSSAPKVEKKIEKKPKKPQEIVQPKEIPQEKPKEAEPDKPPEPEVEQPGGQVGGVEGGVQGGTVGGVVGGTVGGVIGGTGTGTDVLPFGEGMTRPENIKNPPIPVCPREAREAQINGLVLASCTVTIDGYLKDCKIIKPLPHVDEMVREILQTWRVGPVYFQGQPVPVNYKIPIRIVCK